jgi:ABC-type Mn2+/Zn2+ transport system ATPase subunit
MAKATIEKLTIRNYRVLRDVTFDKLTPLTVLFGPNGSGKSSVFEIRSRGSSGLVEFELKYRPTSKSRLVTSRIAIDEDKGRPIVAEELLRWAMSPKQGRPTEILRYSHEHFADALSARELWVLYRGTGGFTGTKRASDMQTVVAMKESGAMLGDLWMEGYFGVGSPFDQVGSVP